MPKSTSEATFGARLKERRGRAQLTQTDLAKRMGWEAQTRISNYETDTREPSFDELIRLCEVLECTADELLYPESRRTNKEARSHDLGELGELTQEEEDLLMAWRACSRELRDGIHNMLYGHLIEKSPKLAAALGPRDVPRQRSVEQKLVDGDKKLRKKKPTHERSRLTGKKGARDAKK